MKYCFHKRSVCSLALYLLLFWTTLLGSIPTAVVAAEDEDVATSVKRWASQVREQYEQLPDQGKFVTGAVVGYGASKLVVRSAVRVVKIAGAAFIATEVLEAVGIIDMDDIVSDESTQSIKQRALSRLGDIKKSFKKFDLKELVNNPVQKAGALGAAAGAMIGFLL
mmetsp:Transcript_15129/g.24483  ORF Transcript_15129/g.24483 Transcript_15129/m.24483 type:complete len:166 (-) Transcript_15129:268-765(-)